MIYEIAIGQSVSLVQDKWLILAHSLLEAVKKAESKLYERKETFTADWVIVSAKEVGKLEEFRSVDFSPKR